MSRPRRKLVHVQSGFSYRLLVEIEIRQFSDAVPFQRPLFAFMLLVDLDFPRFYREVSTCLIHRGVLWASLRINYAMCNLFGSDV